MPEAKPAAAHIRGSDGAEQPLKEHLANVAELSRRAAAKFGCGEAGALIGLVHDLGKYSVAFQGYLASAAGTMDPDADDYVDARAMRGKIDHSTAGAQFIWSHMPRQSNEASYVAQMLALAVASHHSGLIDCVKSTSTAPSSNGFLARMDKSDQLTHLSEVMAAVDREVFERATEILRDQRLLDEVQRLLRSIHKANPSATTRHFQFGLGARMLFSCLVDADRIDSADFELANRRDRGIDTPMRWHDLINRFEVTLRERWANQPPKPIDERRRDVSQKCLDSAGREGGIYSLTVPTGGGKTLASLRFALHHASRRRLDRIIYFVPYTSIIDQNARDARRFLEPPGAGEANGAVVLEHHSNLTSELQTWRAKLVSENWDAPVVFTTMVQFLEAFFGGGTRGARRLHQLASAVLVFDEIQTLPVKCVHLFNNAINFLTEQCNSTVLLCTATQPLLADVAKDKGALRFSGNKELVPDPAGLSRSLKRVRIRFLSRPCSFERIAELANRESAKTGSCLVVVNTKTAARRIHQILALHHPAEELFHLSTDMCPAHRTTALGAGADDPGPASIMGRLARRLPTICISTQLIEAGIDIDFGSVIRFLAGLDSIAQAAGRCNRHGHPQHGRVWVVTPEQEHLDRLPDIAKGQQAALRVFDEYARDPATFEHDILGPTAMTTYYRYYFFERKEEMVYPLANGAERALGRPDSVLGLLGSNEGGRRDLNAASAKMLFAQSFTTAAAAFRAIEAPTEGVVVSYGRQGAALIGQLREPGVDLAGLRRIMAAAQRYTVPVYPNSLDRLVKASAVQRVSDAVPVHVLVDDTFYSPVYGLNIDRDPGWSQEAMVQ